MANLKKDITNHLIGRGFNEILTIPMIDVRVTDSGSKKAVRLLNSMTAELNAMRTDLADGMLRIIASNFNNLGKDISLRLFETGRVFEDKGNTFEEREFLMFALAGRNDGRTIYEKDRRYDLYDIKGEAEMLLSKLNIETFGLFYYTDNQFGGVRIDVGLNNTVVGNINKADKNLLKAYDIDSDVFFCRFFVDELKNQIRTSSMFVPITKFPTVKRDIALVVDADTRYEDVAGVLKESGGMLLKSVELIDVYQGEQVGDGKKSIAFSLEFASPERTLTDAETNDAMKKIIKSLQAKAGATLRS
jgi:phenylalanyl-tRNA synthetase beta chain